MWPILTESAVQIKYASQQRETEKDGKRSGLKGGGGREGGKGNLDALACQMIALSIPRDDLTSRVAVL